MAERGADRNLLIGSLAVQLNFISRQQLLSALNEWNERESTPLSEILRSQGALTDETQQLLEVLAQKLAESHDPALPPDLIGTISDSVSGQLRRLAQGEPAADFAQRSTLGPEIDPQRTLELPSGPARPASNSNPGGNGGLRFRVLRPHAQGGLGRVSVAQDLELHREVALKELLDFHAHDADTRLRFLMEAEITGGLEHPGIVPVYGFGVYADGRPYYAMRFIHGNSLTGAIDHYHTAEQEGRGSTGERTMELRKLLTRLIDVCNAIDYAHSRNVIHRDLKPGNIMLGPYGETLVVDWGLAKSLDRPDSHSAATASQAPLQVASASGLAKTVLGTAMGTPAFMSPEQAAGRIDEVGPASDIYSLGATLFYVLTGQPPMQEKNLQALLENVQAGEFPRPRHLNKQVPQALEAICLKAMALAPQDRYATARALADDLEHWLADEPVSVHRERLADRAARWTRRHRAWALASSAAVLTILAVLAIAIVIVNGQRQAAEKQRRIAERLAIEKGELAEEEQALRKKAQWQAASRLFEQSLAECVQEDPAVGLLALTECLDEAVRIEADDLERSIRGQLARWSGAVHRLDSLVEFPDAVRAVAISPDGKSVLVSSGKTALLTDFNTGKPIGKPLLHQDVIPSLAFSRDGATVATGSHDKTARLWIAESGDPMGEPFQHSAAVNTVALSPDGKSLAVGCENGEVSLWNVESHTLAGIKLTHAMSISAVTFSPDGKLILTASWDGDARLWDAETGTQKGDPLLHDSAVLAGAFDPKGMRVITGELGNRAQLWDVATGKTIGSPLAHQAMVLRVGFAPDGKTAVTTSADQTARLWDVATSKSVGPPLRHPGIVNGADFSPSGRSLVTGCGDKGLRRWQLATGNSQRLTFPRNGNVLAVALPGDGPTALTITGGIAGIKLPVPGEAQRWNIATGEPVETSLKSFDWVDLAAISPDAGKLAAGADEASAQLWDLKTGEKIGSPLASQGKIKAIMFSPDGQTVLTAGEDKAIRLWNARTGAVIDPPLPHPELVGSADFRPDGRAVLTGCWDNSARIWDLSRLNSPAVEFKHAAIVTAVAFRRDGLAIATGAADGTVRLWNALSGEPMGSVLKHDARITAAAFSPDGHTLLTGSMDATACLWDTRTFGRIGPPMRHDGPLISLSFSADGKHAITSSTDWSARVWQTSPVEGDVTQVVCWSQVLTGLARTSDRAVQVLDAEAWLRSRAELVGPETRQD